MDEAKHDKAGVTTADAAKAGAGPHRRSRTVSAGAGEIGKSPASGEGQGPVGQRRRSVGARRSEASETAILDAAEAILAERGLGGFTIEAVARVARAGKPTIYRWWPNRAALVLAVYQRQKRSISEADTGSIVGDCLAFLTGLLDHWRDTPGGAVAASVIAEAQADRETAEALAAYFDDRHRHTAMFFERGKVRGEIGAHVDSLLAAETLVSFARGRLLVGRLDAPCEEIERAVRQIVEGLRA